MDRRIGIVLLVFPAFFVYAFAALAATAICAYVWPRDTVEERRWNARIDPNTWSEQAIELGERRHFFKSV